MGTLQPDEMDQAVSMDVGSDHGAYRGGYWGATGRGGHIALSWPLARLELTESVLEVRAVRGFGWCFQPLTVSPNDGCVVGLSAMTLDFVPRGREPFFFYSISSAEIARRMVKLGYVVRASS